MCYVGETGDPLYIRTQNHLSSIRTHSPTVCLPVRMHFREQNHSIDDAWVVGLERLWERNVDFRWARERRWIGLLGAGRMRERQILSTGRIGINRPRPGDPSISVRAGRSKRWMHFNPCRCRGGEGATRPPIIFLKWLPNCCEDRAEILHNLWGILCTTFGKKK